jgi:hypothetical protein
MKLEDANIITEKKKAISLNDNILSNVKWGFIMNSHDGIFNIITNVIKKGKEIDQSFYSVGQGINEKESVFIPIKYEKNIKQKENIINAIYKEYLYSYNKFEYFIYHSFTKNKDDTLFLKEINALEYFEGKEIKRKNPSILMPRGIGSVHFAGIIPKRALSNSYVEIYMKIPDEEILLNVWLFCNSSLFFLYREISGRKNLGGGLLKAEATDINNIPLYFPIASSKVISSLINAVENPFNLPERLKSETQKNVDELVFEYLGISDKYDLIASELKYLFDFRFKKAKT